MAACISVAMPRPALACCAAGSPWAEQELVAPQAELDKYADSTRLVVITKANLRSTIHRAELMDVISVKRFDAAGNLIGTVRLLGLFSTEAYIDRPRQIPLVRAKADYVIARSRLGESSHSGKKLRDILHGLPRDELFQSNEEELFRLCLGIRALRDRHRLRLFMRRDRYGRFYSFLVYLPRERYSRELRDKVGRSLMAICGGTALDRNVEAVRGDLTRLHLIVRTPPGTTIVLSAAEVEAQVVVATRSWRDQLRDALSAEPQLAARYGDAFPLSYSEAATPSEAAADARVLALLDDAHPLSARLEVSMPDNGLPRATGLKLYTRDCPIALSDVLPTLENFGFRITRQDPSEVMPRDGGVQVVQAFDVAHGGCALAPATQAAYFETAFLAAWRGEIENDGLNKLVLGAGLSARQVTYLRALTKYLLQTGLPFSQPYIEGILIEHAAIARLLVIAFETRFDPALSPDLRSGDWMRTSQALDHALDQVASLDADRVLRAFVAVIRAALRTNAWQKTADGSTKAWLSIKLDPAKIPELPAPRPMFEIWVYSPEVEGVHLRGGRVARGGLRWSDRRQDFRTEVLGLMKAQQVKNTVIVPVGAKGGFVVKKPVDSSNREAWMAQGIACYKTFLRGLLDLTDNRVGTAILPPADTVRVDPDDAYLVVAADKGTATFSDYANGVSAEYGFWLGDAFASGGSAGYDHKKMGITARGAWESVKRHFREMTPGIDIQTEAFTAVGIGDMSGDVFGNGMLLSPTMRPARRLRSPPHLSRSDAGTGRESGRAHAAISASAFILGRLRRQPDFAGWRHLSAFGQAHRDHPGSARSTRSQGRCTDPGRADESDPDRAGRSAVERRHRHLCESQRPEQRRSRRPRQRCDSRQRPRSALQGGRRGRQSGLHAGRAHRIRRCWRPDQYRCHRQRGRRPYLRPRGEHQDRAQRTVQHRRTEPRGPRSAAGLDDR